MRGAFPCLYSSVVAVSKPKVRICYRLQFIPGNNSNKYYSTLRLSLDIALFKCTQDCATLSHAI